jgi:hypothetical protein
LEGEAIVLIAGTHIPLDGGVPDMVIDLFKEFRINRIRPYKSLSGI